MNAFQGFMATYGRDISLGLSVVGTGLGIGSTINTTRLQVATLGANASLLRRGNEVAQIGFTQKIRDLRIRHQFLRGTILDTAGRSGVRTTSGSVTAKLAGLAGEVRLTELRAQFNLENETLVRNFQAETLDARADALESQLPFKVAGQLLGGIGDIFKIFRTPGGSSTTSPIFQG